MAKGDPDFNPLPELNGRGALVFYMVFLPLVFAVYYKILRVLQRPDIRRLFKV